MKVVVLYRPVSEHATSVEQYAREFKHRTSKDLELLDVDSKEGSAMAELYDVVRYPCFLALTDEGVLQKIWMDQALPLINEVTGYIIERG
jgi:hypothetical protein